MEKLTIDGIETEIPLLSFYELSEEEQKDLIEYDGYQDSSFFKYRDSIYDLSDFMRIEGNSPDQFKGYNGYKSETFFSGILVKLEDDSVSVASYYS